MDYTGFLIMNHLIIENNYLEKPFSDERLNVVHKIYKYKGTLAKQGFL